jgi:hypothetical protein
LGVGQEARVKRSANFVLSILLGIIITFSSISCSSKDNVSSPGNSTDVGNQTASGNIPLVVPMMVGPGELGLAGTVTEVKCSSQKGAQLEKDGIIISVPAGAVSIDKVMTIKECIEDPPPYIPKTGDDLLPVAVSLSKTYDLGPDGITFDKPVTITLPYDETLLEENVDSARIGIFYFNGQNWILAGGLVDRQKGTVTISLNSFPGLLVEVALGGVILSSFGYAITKGYKYLKGDPVSNKNVSSLVTPNDPVITKYAPTSGVHTKVGGVYKWITLEDPANSGQVNPEFKNYLKSLNPKSQDRIGFDGDNKGIGYTPTYAIEEEYRWLKPGAFFSGNAKGDCTSIALAYLSLLKKMGIKAYGVDGYKSDLPGSKRHTWVEFLIDGEVYYYDHDEGIKNLRDIESKLTRPIGLKKEGYMWDEKEQKRYSENWWQETSIIPPNLTGEVNQEYTFQVETSTSNSNPQYEWYINDVYQNAIFADNIFKIKFTTPGLYTIRVKLINSSGYEIASAISEVTIKGPTTPVITGYWQYKGTWHNEIQKVDPMYTGQQWEVTTLTDGAISAIEKIRDNSVESRPWLEKTFDYTWSVSAKNGDYKEKLFDGDEITVNMSLTYVGIDPKKLLGQARMYCGAFDKYKDDNIVVVNNPGGSATKQVTMPVSQGYKGAMAYIKVHCEGGYQGFEFAYLYEWVPAGQ